MRIILRNYSLRIDTISAIVAGHAPLCSFLFRPLLPVFRLWGTGHLRSLRSSCCILVLHNLVVRIVHCLVFFARPTCRCRVNLFLRKHLPSRSLFLKLRDNFNWPTLHLVKNLRRFCLWNTANSHVTRPHYTISHITALHYTIIHITVLHHRTIYAILLNCNSI